MTVLLLTALLLVLLYRAGTTKGRMQLAFAFAVTFALLPFLIQIVVLRFGFPGFWSLCVAIGLISIVVFCRDAARKSNASN